MNIDKDIEIVKGIKRTSLTGGFDKQTIRLNAISNILKALEGKDCVIETQAHNEDVYEELVEKLEKELETYKKIAEKLAEYIAEKSNFCANKCCMNEECHDNDCIIDWARKEVENEVHS